MSNKYTYKCNVCKDECILLIEESYTQEFLCCPKDGAQDANFELDKIEIDMES